MEKHISRLYKTCSYRFYSPLMNGHGVECAARRGGDENDSLADLGRERPRDFYIEIVAEAFI